MKERFTGPRARIAALGIAVATVGAACTPAQRAAIEAAFPCAPRDVASVGETGTGTEPVSGTTVDGQIGVARLTDPIVIPAKWTGGETDVIICLPNPNAEQAVSRPTPTPTPEAISTISSTQEALDTLLGQKDKQIRNNIKDRQIEEELDKVWNKYKDHLGTLKLPYEEGNLTKKFIKNTYLSTMFDPNMGSDRAGRGGSLVAVMLFAYDSSVSAEEKQAILKFSDLVYDYSRSIDLPGRNKNQELKGLNNIIKSGLENFLNPQE